MEVTPVEVLLKRFTGYDYAVFICMLAISGILGLYCAFSGGTQKTIRDLLTGNANLPPFLVSTSLMASFISASYILGNVAEIYTHGIMYFYILGAYYVVIAVSAHVYMPVFYQNGVLTCYEYLELRFNRWLRCFAVVCYIIQMMIYIAIQLYAPALALSYVTGMGLWTCVIAIGVVCTVYTSIGGVKAVVWTDTFQAYVMLAAMVTVVALGFKEIGGFGNAWQIAKKGNRIVYNDINPDPTTRHTIWGLLIGTFFTCSASYATNQMMVLRYFCVKTLKRAKLVIWGNVPYLSAVLILSCLCGLMSYAHYAQCDPLETKQIDSYDKLLPYFVMDVLGKRTGIPGVFVAGIFAASLSSISSATNSLADVLFNDFVYLVWPETTNTVGAKIIVVLGALCGFGSIGLVVVAQAMGDVLQATTAVTSGIGGPLFGLFSVGMFIPHVNTKGAMCGFIASLCISLWLNMGAFFYPGPIIPAPPIISVDQCKSAYMHANNMTRYTPPAQYSWSPEAGFLDPYRISYVWYTAIGVIVLFIVAIPVSFFTGANDPRKMNPDLIATPFDFFLPFVHKQHRQKLKFHVGADYDGPKHGKDNEAFDE